jgi:hypothetical protein
LFVAGETTAYILLMALWEAKMRWVTVWGGDAYKVDEYNGTYYVKKGDDQVGKTQSLEDALALVKAHSGKDIKSIE